MIYDSYVVDSCRTIITRWRLSNFELAIETGRYTRPKTDREQRLCRTCLTVEDEYHVFFICPLYNQVRTNHPDLFSHPYSVKRILNPNTRESVYKTAYVLFEIEKIHKKFNQWELSRFLQDLDFVLVFFYWIGMIVELLLNNVCCYCWIWLFNVLDNCWMMNAVTIEIGYLFWYYCLVLIILYCFLFIIGDIYLFLLYIHECLR